MALHEQSVGKTNEWYTPPSVFQALGCTFDLDAASPGQSKTPWIPAKQFMCSRSLETPWRGFVWLNPPFGARNGLTPWLDKFVQHGDGICLVPDRTSAPWWQQFAPQADLVLFISGKLKFIGADGRPGMSPAQGTCLFSIGERGNAALKQATGLGFLTQHRSARP
jgi:DNA N-6-adenine-methyltransferase (Dam)